MRESPRACIDEAIAADGDTICYTENTSLKSSHSGDVSQRGRGYDETLAERRNVSTLSSASPSSASGRSHLVRAASAPSRPSSTSTVSAARAMSSTAAAEAPAAPANPLLESSDLPKFSSIEPSQLTPAMSSALEKLEADFAAMKSRMGEEGKESLDFDDVLPVVEKMQHPLEFSDSSSDISSISDREAFHQPASRALVSFTKELNNQPFESYDDIRRQLAVIQNSDAAREMVVYSKKLDSPKTAAIPNCPDGRFPRPVFRDQELLLFHDNSDKRPIVYPVDVMKDLAFSICKGHDKISIYGAPDDCLNVCTFLGKKGTDKLRSASSDLKKAFPDLLSMNLSFDVDMDGGSAVLRSVTIKLARPIQHDEATRKQINKKVSEVFNIPVMLVEDRAGSWEAFFLMPGAPWIIAFAIMMIAALCFSSIWWTMRDGRRGRAGFQYGGAHFYQEWGPIGDDDDHEEL